MMHDEKKTRLIDKLERELGETILNAMRDRNVVEIMLNPDGKVWLDVAGKGMVDTGTTMMASQALNLLGTIAATLDVVVNAEHPVLEGTLMLDGSRFEGLVPPLVAAPIFAIRKKAAMIFTLDDYVSKGIMRDDQAAAIRKAVIDRENVLIVGGTGTGKTTLANAVLQVVADVAGGDERIAIIEDTAELQCPAQNKVEMLTSHNAGIDMIKLLKATMRLRPDRIVVGEVRGGEALALLKAWNTGHPGGVATVHANSAAAGLIRLEQLVQEAGVPPQPALIAEAVNIIVSIARTAEGRRVQEVCRVTGHSTKKGYEVVPA